MDKVVSGQEQVTNESRKMRILRKNQRETLEIKKKKSNRNGECLWVYK